MHSSFKPIIIDDIDIWELFKSENSYCIGSKSIDRYIKVSKNRDLIYRFCKKLDGSYTIKELIQVYKKEGINIDVNKMVEILCRAGLIINIGDEYIDKNEMDKLAYKIFEVNIENKIKFFKKLSNVIFPYLFYITIFINFIAAYYCIKYYKIFFELNIYNIRNSYDYGILILILALSISLILHEISHGIIASRYGLIPQKAVVSLYLMISLVAYLKIPGIYTLKPKKRIIIWIAGMYTNLCIASIFILLYFCTDIAYKEIFYAIGVSNLICICMNISPFMPTDGYFIMSTILKSPNMRKNITSGKFNIIDRNNVIKSIYLIITVMLMFTIIITQIYFIIKSILIAHNESNNIWQFIMKIKVFILIIILIVVKSLIKNKKGRGIKNERKHE